MTDEHGSIAQKRGAPKDVARMAARVDDVSDRLVGMGTNKQPLPLANATSRVDPRNRAFANDESYIRNRAVVLACHKRGHAMMHE
jgi:hypothetical protein